MVPMFLLKLNKTIAFSLEKVIIMKFELSLFLT